MGHFFSFMSTNTPSLATDGAASSKLSLPPVTPLDHRSGLAHTLRQTLAGYGSTSDTLGRLESLALQVGLTQHQTQPVLQPLQVLVVAADHGILDEQPIADHQVSTAVQVQRILTGQSPVQTLAQRLQVPLTLVDAGMTTTATPSDGGHTRLLTRKIGFGTRNMARGSAMTGEQTLAALRAGMDVVQHLPGNVLALGVASAGADIGASIILSRLCAVSLEETLPDASRFGSDAAREHLLRTQFDLLRKHRPVQKPLSLLAAVGGFDLAMLVGAIIQAANERRLILVDGYVSGAAALLARELRPAVMDYLVFSHRSGEHRHRLMLIHLQAEPLLDLRLHTEDGTAPLLAWPLVQAAAALLAQAPDHLATLV